MIAALGLAGLGAYAYVAQRGVGAPAPGGQAGARPGGPAQAGGGAPGGFAIGVETERVAATTLADDVSAVGTLRSNESVVLRPEIAGRIRAIHFRDGAKVGKGTPLVSLDAAIQEAELQQARANLALAQANYRRTEDLFGKKFISERAKDEAAATLKVQEAATALAQARLARTRIVAPFAGIVGIRNVSVGDYVKEGQDLINLEDISTLKVDFRLPERYLGRIGKGQSVDLDSDAMPGARYRATVDAIDPLVDTEGRAVLLRARLANPEGKLRPGLFVRVKLIFAQRGDVLTVAEEALVPSGSEQFVFRVAEGKAQRVKVRTGKRQGTRVEVLEGLQAGDLVVTAGQIKLRDGASVKVIDPAAQAAASGGIQKQ